MSDGSTSGPRAIVAGHGDFAQGLVSAVDVITGRGAQLIPVAVPGLCAEDIEKLIRASIPATDQRSSRPAAHRASGGHPASGRGHDAAKKTRAGSGHAPRSASAPRRQRRRRSGASGGQHAASNGHAERRHDPNNLASLPFLQPAVRPQPRTARAASSTTGE